jgi:UDP-N-acetylmuramoyl-L-alanyl-D-glutamate--2,6-diaminopimelate ligase
MSRRTIEPTTASAVALLAGDRATVSHGGAVVTGVSDDSRTVVPGDIFFCIRGSVTDGHTAAAAAVASGATALVVDHVLGDVPGDVAQVVVPDVRSVVGPLVSALTGNPASHMRMVAVTGTNGKTSTAHFIAGILGAAGRRTKVIGTLSGLRTTPEPVELHSQLADALAEGVDTVVMEVSSHALVLGRVDGIVFDVAVFTNLSRDHLDFHGTMEDYFAAKASLFTAGRTRSAVVNTGDTYGRRIADACTVPLVTYSVADAQDLRVGPVSVSFVWRGEPVSAPVGGRFMAENLIAAATAASACGLDAATVSHACGGLGPVPGRHESVPTGGEYSVIVDYAHTPEALASLLASVRAVAAGRVIVVFGCGGDRDRGKRPEMGAVAAAGADIVIVTSDNPRNESPGAIIGEITAGMRGAVAEVETQEDRAAAIASAIGRAGSGDIVVVAGKGHEPYQEVAGVYVPFSDVEVARVAIERRSTTR